MVDFPFKSETPGILLKPPHPPYLELWAFLFHSSRILPDEMVIIAIVGISLMEVSVLIRIRHTRT